MRRCEALAERAGVEGVHGLVGHGGEAVIALVVARHGLLLQDALGLGGIGDQRDLAAVDDRVELVHDHGVEHLAEVAQAQTLLIGLLAHADAELVALAGVHHALHVVEPAVDVALDDGLEVLLHLCARDLDVGGQRIVALGGIGADDADLVILDLVHAAHGDQLAGHVLAAVELHLHVLLADDFALERGGEGHGDVDLLDLDLDAAQLQGLLDGHAVVGDGLQRARNGQIADGLIHHHREAQRDCARTGGDHDLIQRAEGVDERRNALLGVG